MQWEHPELTAVYQVVQNRQIPQHQVCLLSDCTEAEEYPEKDSKLVASYS